MTQPNPMMSLTVALIAPMFLPVSGGDPDIARMAAIATISDYRARTQSDLMAIAQIIACGLAALCALCRSMEDDLPIPTMLSLQRTGLALNRCVEQNRRVIRQDRDAKTRTEPEATAAAMPMPAEPSAPEPGLPQDIELFLTAAAAQHLAAESEARLQTQDQPPARPVIEPATSTSDSEKRNQEMWAIAMVHEASEITASIPALPPEHRRAATIRAAALAGAANEILTGVPPRPPLLDPPNPQI